MKRSKILATIIVAMLIINVSWGQIYTPGGSIEGSTGTNDVSIGISTPAAKLHVAGTDYYTSHVIIQRSATGGGWGPSLDVIAINASSPYFLNNAKALGYLNFRGSIGSTTTFGTGASIAATATETWDASGQGTKLQFYTVPNNSTTNTERMMIDQNGNIGIGESAPNEKLEVNGNISLTGNIMGYRSTGSYSLAANTSYTDGGTVTLYGNSEASTPGQLKLIASGATGDIEFLTNSSARMRILDNGNVGIGTITPAELLTVNGKILAEEVEVVADVDDYPDFVFLEDYKLLTIKEVEQFIVLNHHLPNVPSLSDVKKDGINLGKMSTILLQKIEELTLYVIELKNENEEIKTKLNSQTNQQ